MTGPRPLTACSSPATSCRAVASPAISKLTLLPLERASSWHGGPSPGPRCLSAKTLTSYATVHGLDGQPALALAGVTQPRTAYTLTRTAVLSGGTALGIFGLVLVVGLGLTLDTMVLPDHLRVSSVADDPGHGKCLDGTVCGEGLNPEPRRTCVGPHPGAAAPLIPWCCATRRRSSASPASASTTTPRQPDTHDRDARAIR